MGIKHTLINKKSSYSTLEVQGFVKVLELTSEVNPFMNWYANKAKPIPIAGFISLSMGGARSVLRLGIGAIFAFKNVQRRNSEWWILFFDHKFVNAKSMFPVVSVLQTPRRAFGTTLTETPDRITKRVEVLLDTCEKNVSHVMARQTYCKSKKTKKRCPTYV